MIKYNLAFVGTCDYNGLPTLVYRAWNSSDLDDQTISEITNAPCSSQVAVNKLRWSSVCSQRSANVRYAIVATIHCVKMEGSWASTQLNAATAAGRKLVLQPVTNLNSWTCGVQAHIGMRVEANPAFVDAYAKYGNLARWGISSGLGTVVGTCDYNSELVVEWDDGIVGNCRSGKDMDYWLMTAE